MSTPETPLPWIIYLLHFDVVTGSKHYVGITEPPRLDARMREHASGRGSKTTAEACALGLTWKLAATFPTDDRSLEQKLQNYPRLDMFCPVCFGRPAIRQYRPSKKGSHTKWDPSDEKLLVSLKP